MPEDLVGKQVGSYRIVRKLGQGGMGAVFEAVHEGIGQRAAVKVLDSELSSNRKHVERFFDEARAIGMVQHPGLVKIFDFSRLPDGTVYILMELLSGESLWTRHERILAQKQSMPVPDVLRLVRQLASTLAAVHDKGIVHRDLKPDNVMIIADPEAPGGERAKILDFGIAMFSEVPGTTGRRTTVGMVLGTPAYMSPEQCRGADALTAKVDVYALGVMCFELLAGRPPFQDTEGGMIMAKHIFEKPPRLSGLRGDAPDRVATLVEEMLAKEPQDRPTMAEVVERLSAMGAGTAAHRSLPLTMGTALGRRRLALGLAAGLGALALLGGAIWLWPGDEPAGRAAGKGKGPAVAAPARAPVKAAARDATPVKAAARDVTPARDATATGEPRRVLIEAPPAEIPRAAQDKAAQDKAEATASRGKDERAEAPRRKSKGKRSKKRDENAYQVPMFN